MATARKIELTTEEEQTLRMWTRAGTTEQRLSRRAQVILCCAQGLRIRETSEQCGLSQLSVFKWKKSEKCASPFILRKIKKGALNGKKQR